MPADRTAAASMFGEPLESIAMPVFRRPLRQLQLQM